MDFLADAARTGAGAAGDLANIAICANSDSGCLLQSPADCAAEECRGRVTMIIFPFIALFFGVVAKPLTRIIKLPYTLTLLLAGIVLGLFGCGVDMSMLSTSLRQWVHLNPPQIFFYVFLAPLIFEAAFNTQLHVFRRVLVPVLTLAFVVVLLQLGLIAAFQKLVIRTEDWTWWAALMFGAMLSATDPISVTATLKSVGASEALNTLIEGESLLNDGSAFVLWEAFFENTAEEGSKSVGEIVIDIFRLSVGGALMGVAFGLVALIVLSFVYDEFEVETSITVVVAFLGFWTAQSPSRLSGVICNVASGLLISSLGRPLISPAVRGPLGEFWELLSWIANTIVFVHAGVLVSSFVWSCSGDPHGYSDYLFILAYFAFLQLIRFGLIFLFMPILRIQNKWFSWKEATVLGASGLRGAVSLVLALEVGSTASVPAAVRSRVVLWTTGIVLLSLVVNGLAVKPILHLLKLDKADKTREDFMRRARSLVVQRTLMILDTLSIEGSLKQARWSYVAENVLPDDWLESDEHTKSYVDAVSHYGTTPGNRASLDLVAGEGRRHLVVAETGRRFSLDMDASRKSVSSPGTPRPYHGEDNFELTSGDALRTSPQGRRALGYSPPRRVSADTQDTPAEDVRLGPSAASGAGTNALDLPIPSRRYSLDHHDPGARASIDHDVYQYARRSIRESLEAPRASTELQIHREIAALHHAQEQGHPMPSYSDQDREILRRMLTSMLAKVRSLVNATLSEFAVLVNLDEDIQRALDANEAGEDFDMYDFLDRRGLKQNRWYYRWLRFATERGRSRGETSITTAHVLIIVLTHVLKEEFMHDSALVYFQAESLYEGAATLLNRLESLNMSAVSWVESQFAVHLTYSMQDSVLDEMLNQGSLDSFEHTVLHEELLEVRRRHFVWTSRLKHLPPKPAPRELLKNHDFFRGMDPEQASRVLQGSGVLHNLRGGQLLDSDPGDLVIVLKGALRPVVGSSIPLPDEKQCDSSGDDIRCRHDVAGGEGSHAFHFTSGGTMHWCFPMNNVVVGPDVALVVANATSGPMCATVRENLRAHPDTRLRCCEVNGSATVWTLPVKDVRAIAKRNELFRTEVARSLARQMVLESISDLPPYSLSHVKEAISGADDDHTIIGRASKLLERLPYMELIALRSTEGTVSKPVHGPGVLLNGTVRVSIVDTSGLVGAVNLLHEELTGPALLPSGGLVIEEVPSNATESTQSAPQGEGNAAVDHMPNMSSDFRFAAFAAQATNIIGSSSESDVPSVDGGTEVSLGRAFAHILIEEMSDEDQVRRVAARRLRRWTGPAVSVDQNGRHAIVRHVSLNRNALDQKSREFGGDSGEVGTSDS